MFTLTDVVMVRALTDKELHAFEKHGCTFEPYPCDDLPFVHRVRFPDGCTMQEQTPTQYEIVFPDGYTAHMVWLNDRYHLYAARGEDGQLLA